MRPSFKRSRTQAQDVALDKDGRDPAQQLEHARRTAEEDAKFRFPMASNRFADPALQLAYSQRYAQVRK